MGHDVFYIEDTGQWPFNPVEGGLGEDCALNVAYLSDMMAAFGLEDRWAYRFPWQSQWFGLSDAKRQEVIDTADVVINVSGTLEKPEKYRAAKHLIYIDSDPMFTQIKLAKRQDFFRKQIDLHDSHFTFGEYEGTKAPETGHNWIPTRQPIVIDEWRHQEPPREVFTTVMNWTSYNDVIFDGETYGQKDSEFLRFMDLPGRVGPGSLEIAANAGKTRSTPVERLEAHGWRLVDPAEACPDVDSYRRYLQTSKGEWSVAKNAYVGGDTGWFSCRSACYLAAGRPVVVQDTGFSKVLPVGEGVLPFTTLEEAVNGIQAVVAEPDRHSKAAVEICAAYFSGDVVLSKLLETALNDG
jgi:hypothetical protein